MSTPPPPYQPYRPEQPEQLYQAGQPYPAQYAPASPMLPAKKKKNPLGIIALVLAILGFISSCIKGMLIVGWVLLPLAFILGVIALFFPQRRKGQAIAAIIISIIGTVVAVIVFMFVVGDSFNKAFNEETTVSNSGTDSSKQGASRETPLPLGSTLETKDWAVTINSVDLNATEAVMAENQFNEAPTADQTYILVNATIKFKGDEASGSTPMSSIQYVTAEGNSISSGDNLAVAPESLDTLSTLYKDASVTGNMVFAVPAASAARGVLAVRPDMFSEKKFVAVQ